MFTLSGFVAVCPKYNGSNEYQKAIDFLEKGSGLQGKFCGIKGILSSSF